MNQSSPATTGARVAFVQAGWHADIVAECRKAFVAEIQHLTSGSDRVAVLPGAGHLRNTAAGAHAGKKRPVCGRGRLRVGKQAPRRRHRGARGDLARCADQVGRLRSASRILSRCAASREARNSLV